MATTPFYGDGLRFTCQQCHRCCRGSQPGGVYPSRRDVLRIARWLETTVSNFRQTYMGRSRGSAPHLRLRPSGDCIFWDGGCTIYPVRPRQCRTFPFWPENLRSPESWSDVQKTCRGAGQGRLYRLDEIRAIVHGRST